MGSSNSRFLLGLLIGLVVGGGLVSLVSGPGPGPDVAAGGLTPDEGHPQAAAQTGAALPEQAPGSSRELAPPPAARAKVELTDAEVDDLVRTVDDVAAARGSGSGALWGRVTDEDGAAMVGVVVRIKARSRRGSTSTSRVGADAPELESLEEAVREAVEDFKQQRASLYEAVTDDGGLFRLEGLEDRSWNLWAYKAGYIITADANAFGIPTDSEVDFTARPVVEIPVTVHGPGGASVASALLGCRKTGSNESLQRYAWSKDSAYLRLSPGRYEVTAYSDEEGTTGGAAMASEPLEVEVVRGATPAPLRLQLESRLGIRGRITQTKGDLKVDYFSMRLQALAPQQELDLKAMTESGQQDWTRPGDEYAFPDLEPGRYAVGAARSWDGPIVVHEVLELTDRPLRVDLVAPPFDRSDMLRALVTGPDGQLLDQVSFSFTIRTGSTSHGSGLAEMRDDGGSYLITLGAEEAEQFFGEGADGATYELTAHHGEYGRQDLELTPGQTEVAMSFNVPGSLVVTVAGYQGSGLEGRLEVNMPSRKGSGITHFFGGNEQGLSPEGVQEFKAMEPGTYVVKLSLRPEGSGPRTYSNSTIATVEVEVLPGPNAVQIGVPALYTFRAHWADGKEGATLFLRLYDRESGIGSANAKLGGDGWATFQDVPAGDYLLTSGGRRNQMRVSVPSEDVEFVPMTIDCLRVIVNDPAGDLGRIGFRSGDLIIGADGKEFEAQPDFAAFATLQSSKSAVVTFLVERGGEQLEITVKGSDMGDWSDRGGELVPGTR